MQPEVLRNDSDTSAHCAALAPDGGIRHATWNERVHSCGTGVPLRDYSFSKYCKIDESL
jgi:hypothetical protein